MERVRVKICGITNLSDAVTAVSAGADSLGFIFTSSPRQISPDRARDIIRVLPPSVCTVGVFMDQRYEEIIQIIAHTEIDLIQLHGEESPEFCSRFHLPVIKRFDVTPDDTPADLEEAFSAFRVAAHLIDPGTGSGKTFDWNLARDITVSRLILAGGLNPGNIRQAVSVCRPYGVDVCSGVEYSPGIKDPKKIEQLMEELQ